MALFPLFALLLMAASFLAGRRCERRALRGTGAGLEGSSLGGVSEGDSDNDKGFPPPPGASS
eukprot:2380228-Lingulodinium_polyedra.AAC.1